VLLIDASKIKTVRPIDIMNKNIFLRVPILIFLLLKLKLETTIKKGMEYKTKVKIFSLAN